MSLNVAVFLGSKVGNDTKNIKVVASSENINQKMLKKLNKF